MDLRALLNSNNSKNVHLWGISCRIIVFTTIPEEGQSNAPIAYNVKHYIN